MTLYSIDLNSSNMANVSGKLSVSHFYFTLTKMAAILLETNVNDDDVYIFRGSVERLYNY